MKKNVLSFILALCMVITLMPSVSLTANAVSSVWNGTQDTSLAETAKDGTAGTGYYLVDTAEKLAYVAYLSNNGNDFSGKTVLLTNDIILNSGNTDDWAITPPSISWVPIGDWNYNGAKYFNGIFDGQGHTISGLYLKDDLDIRGLFGRIGTNGVVCNVGLVNGYLSGRQIVGGITGFNEGKITNCWNSATVTTKMWKEGDSITFVGGIAGRNGGTITNCYNIGTVGSTSASYIGGIVGSNQSTLYAGTIINCYNAGAIISGSVFGGIVGSSGTASSSIQYCYSLSSAGNLRGNNIGTFIGCGIFADGAETDYITLAEDSATGYTYTYTNDANSDGTTTTTLLSALNAWVNTATRPDLCMWKIEGGYPVFDKFWEPNYTATVTMNKNESTWTSSAAVIKLSTSSASLTEAISGTLSSGVYTFSGLPYSGTYYVFSDNVYTGQSVTSASNAVTVNYYTVTFRNDDNTSTLNTLTVLSGQTAEYDGATPTKPSDAQYSYAFFKWVTAVSGTEEATLTNIMEEKTVYASFASTLLSYSITWKKDDTNTIDTSTVAYGGMPTHSDPINAGYTFDGWTPAITSVIGNATYTASWTANSYNILYQLNGGNVSEANPVIYTIESSEITLNNPTRDGYYFVGWSGLNLTGNTTQSVTISTGSTGDKSYTANWKANTPVAPEASIVTAKTDRSLTITTETGYEYSLGGTNWFGGTGGSYTFADLTAGTPYNLVRRVAAVTTGNLSAASDASPSLTVATKTTGNIIVPTLSAVTYNPAATLAGITLPSGWAWSAPSTVPTVAISGYDAVYTPTDTATVDYSGVTGYTDTGGTVTITQAIGLTVNRATPTAADFNYIPPASLDYSGTSKAVTVAAKGSILGMGTVTVKYYTGEVLTPPVNAGTYTVKIDIAQGGNYAAVTQLTDDAWTFSIAKIPQESLSITSTPASITYGDTFTLATTGGSGTGLVTWAVTAGNSATVSTDGNVTITGIGSTTITATKAADDNYAAAITDTYTFTPEALQLNVDSPAADGGWTKVYDGSMDFDKSSITVGGITNKVGEDAVAVSVATATYDTADIGSANKTLTITYAIVGTNSENYSAPDNTVINNASITPATPTVALVKKTAVFTGSVIEIGEATVTGVASEGAITVNYEGSEDHDSLITYTYYTKDTCTNEDKTTVDKSGAETIGGAPKTVGTYYVKATIPSNGNYAGAESAIATLTIYYPSSGQNLTSAPVIVDGKTVDMGTSEVKGNITTVVVDQKKMTEQLNDAKDSVVIPITSKTDTASAQLVMQNVETMAQRGVSLTVMAGNVSYSIPSGAVDTKEALKALGASDSSKVPFNITISKLSNSSVTIQKGTLMVPPVAFTVTATYNGKSVEVEKFGSYVQRVIEIPTGIDPKSITTAVVLGEDGTQRHVPTEVYKENGKWYARINSMTNSVYGLIENSVSFTDTKSKWYHESVTEMAGREIIGGIGENRFAGERAITRAEFSAILVRALGLPTESQGAEIFSDVNPKRWYYGVVGTAYEYGLVTGKSREKFDPNGNITRQEAMTMIARAATLALYEGKYDSLSGFSDVDGIKSWALDAVKFNVGSGLIVGNKGKLRPQDEISRAETAAVVLRMLQNSKLIDVRE